MTNHVKVRIAHEGEITSDGISAPAAERLWYEVMYPTATGYYCKLNSTPISLDAPKNLDVTHDMILEECDQ